eukprot:gnl/TRDRNA2_/TRDRNA2_173644_c0_seq4.p1 gnl/TRDRNA2_/TRDRNA2_173644_c0~~gnl/TRDRNA2_/TRDRNA2_173644_c0_seq4.p1  ORF type:complete len:736 (-),score=110.05 gnl/TRDRNA2_/TRDRNA2_173644_c0_seq4:39-2141(-)
MMANEICDEVGIDRDTLLKAVKSRPGILKCDLFDVVTHLEPEKELIAATQALPHAAAAVAAGQAWRAQLVWPTHAFKRKFHMFSQWEVSFDSPSAYTVLQLAAQVFTAEHQDLKTPGKAPPVWTDAKQSPLLTEFFSMVLASLREKGCKKCSNSTVLRAALQNAGLEAPTLAPLEKPKPLILSNMTAAAAVQKAVVVKVEDVSDDPADLELPSAPGTASQDAATGQKASRPGPLRIPAATLGARVPSTPPDSIPGARMPSTPPDSTLPTPSSSSRPTSSWLPPTPKASSETLSFLKPRPSSASMQAEPAAKQPRVVPPPERVVVPANASAKQPRIVPPPEKSVVPKADSVSFACDGAGSLAHALPISIQTAPSSTPSSAPSSIHAVPSAAHAAPSLVQAGPSSAHAAPSTVHAVSSSAPSSVHTAPSAAASLAQAVPKAAPGYGSFGTAGDAAPPVHSKGLYQYRCHCGCIFDDWSAWNEHLENIHGLKSSKGKGKGLEKGISLRATKAEQSLKAEDKCVKEQLLKVEDDWDWDSWAIDMGYRAAPVGDPQRFPTVTAGYSYRCMLCDAVFHSWEPWSEHLRVVHGRFPTRAVAPPREEEDRSWKKRPSPGYDAPPREEEDRSWKKRPSPGYDATSCNGRNGQQVETQCIVIDIDSPAQRNESSWDTASDHRHEAHGGWSRSPPQPTKGYGKASMFRAYS